MWRGLLLVSFLSGTAAHAGPECWLVHYGTADGGWLSLLSRVECDCADECPRVRLEAHPPGAQYGGPDLTATVDRYWGRTWLDLDDGQTYTWRATPLRADGGELGTTAEHIAVADTLGPTVTGPASVVLVDGGTLSVSFGAASDPGCGFEVYRTQHALVSDTNHWVSVRWAESSPAAAWLGPGTWVTLVDGHDHVDNQGPSLYSSDVVTIVASPLVAVPAPPAVDTTPTNERSQAFPIVLGALAYVMIADPPDGGSLAVGYLEPGMAGSKLYGWFPEECQYRLRWARIEGGQTSAWSAPSDLLTVDLNAPSRVVGLSATRVGNTAQLTWSASTDSCAGVAHYRVERDDGAGFLLRGASTTDLTFSEPIDDGAHQYRVVAVDRARNEADPSVEAGIAAWVAFDAGAPTPDGGSSALPDAGTAAVDAGAPDAGLQVLFERRFGIGCSATGAQAAWLALLALRLCARRRRS